MKFWRVTHLRVLIVSLCLSSGLLIGITGHAAESELPVIFIAGDSTAATYHNELQQGWGGVFGQYFDVAKVRIDNRARGGRSSRTFITEGHWQQLVEDLSQGDIVLIQFGHNDAGLINDSERARGTLAGLGDDKVEIDNLQTGLHETVYSFGHYIRKMVDDVRAKGAVPVLLSLSVRNIWQSDRIERGSGQYGYWSYQLARELGVAFIDVTNTVADQLELMGATQVAKLYPKDHTHFSTQGAHVHAKAIVASLKGARLDLDSSWFSAEGEQVETYDWAWLGLPFPANDGQPSLFLVGDSTVRNGAGDGANGEWGWGDFLAQSLDSHAFNVVNRAVGGMSSRSFANGGHWQKALNMMKPGDLVVMQFGHNDSKSVDDGRVARGSLPGTGEEQITIGNGITGELDIVHTYGWYLRQMIGQARARGVTVVVCSPVPRKLWSKGLIEQSDNSYPQWALAVARQSRSTFLDLNLLVASQYNRLGEKSVDGLFADKHTHTSEAGARITADIVARQLAPMLFN